METIHQFFSLILHMDQHLLAFVINHGPWVYGLLFLIIFCETGLVVTPFLPGDSLLFAAGTIAGSLSNTINIHELVLLLIIASTLGNTLNYAIGRFIGPKVFQSKTSWLLNTRYLQQAHAFYEQHGGKTIILARFIPIIRTFAPFVAGVGYMDFKSFSAYNLASAILWICTLLYLSYWFGNIPVVRENFSGVILLIIALSFLPLAVEFLKRRCPR